MKKGILVAAMITVMCMAGCQNGEQTNVPTNTTKSTSTATVTATSAPELTEAPTITDAPITTEKTEVTESPDITVMPAVPEEPQEESVVTTMETPTEVPEPTEMPEPIATSKPMATPKPTATSEPTATPKPTATPEPTATPKPTEVPNNEIVYTIFSDMKGFEVHECTAETLKNGDVVFFFQYTAPEGMSVTVFNPPEGDVYKLFDFPVTGGKKEVLKFKLSEKELNTAGYPTIGFFKPAGESVFVGLNPGFGQGGTTGGNSTPSGKVTDMGLTDGTPAGELLHAYVMTGGLPRPQVYKVHGCTVQKLNNGYVRFELEYTAPADTEVMLIPNMSNWDCQQSGMFKAGKHLRLSFDVAESDINAGDYFVLMFEYKEVPFYIHVITDIFYSATTNVPSGAEMREFYEMDQAQLGNYTIHSIYGIKKGNGMYQFYVDCTMPKGMKIQINDPYEEKMWFQLEGDTTGARQQFSFELTPEQRNQSDEFLILFQHATADRIGLVVSTKGM